MVPGREDRYRGATARLVAAFLSHRRRWRFPAGCFAVAPARLIARGIWTFCCTGNRSGHREETSDDRANLHRKRASHLHAKPFHPLRPLPKEAPLAFPSREESLCHTTIG